MPEVAFALAGLGGFNAHGAGFLAAARKAGVVPDLVTATSGQIMIVADWLDGADLKSAIVDWGRENNPVAQMQTALFGLPGVFYPAVTEAIARFWTPPRATDSFVDAIADRFLPAQEYVPDRSDAEFERTAEILNRAMLDGRPVGVLFNAYDLASGTGALYGNDQARKLLQERSNLPAVTFSADQRSWTGKADAAIRPITAGALKSALWLSLYGFKHMPGGQIDGAYHRSCLVAELHAFDRVYIARPLAQGWTGERRPGNWFEVQDWQTEMWFSASYKAEIDAMVRINQLIELGHLKDDRYRIVRLTEIAPTTPAGYFHYFVERGAVFDEAYRAALAAFAS